MSLLIEGTTLSVEQEKLSKYILEKLLLLSYEYTHKVSAQIKRIICGSGNMCSIQGNG